MAATYYSILTKAGLAKASNSLALGIPFAISAMALGDGNGQAVVPNADMTKLVKEVFRAPVNDLVPVPATPGLFLVELYVPLEVGGFTVREMGLYDDKGVLLAVCNTPPTPKLDASTGASSEQVFRFSILLTNTVNPVIMIDPSTVVATRQYVDRTVFQRLKTGVALPTTNIGPIWHDDYASIMTWQEFTANGAAYQGYASQLIGSLLLDTQPTPRQGYIKSGVQNLSRATYAALRAWAMHNGRMVAPGAWQAGTIQCADNADGTTFRVFDVRGEFMRAWDDGRGVDAGRANFSAQNGTIVGVDWSNDSSISAPLTTSIAYDLSGFSGDPAPTTSALQVQTITSALTIVKGNVDSGKAVVTRPRNTALLATIKF